MGEGEGSLQGPPSRTQHPASMCIYLSLYGAFPKIRPIIRIGIFWSLYWGPPI